MNAKDFLTTEEVAKLFRVDRRVVGHWVQSGYFSSSYLVNGHRRFPTREVWSLLPEWATQDVLTTGEVALLFRVCRLTIRRQAEKGKFRWFKTPSGHYRFCKEEVDTLLKVT